MLRRLTLLAIALFLLVMATGGVLLATSTPSHAATGTGTTILKDGVVNRGKLYTTGPPPAGAEKVYFGIEPVQVYDISLTTDTWKVNFYMWYRWKGPYDPAPTTTFDNATGAATNYVITYSYTDAQGNQAPLRLDDGYNYQLAYIQAGFSSNFDLSHYPFDSQKLDIRFENTTYAYNQLVYVPDPSGSSDKGFTVSDWNTSGIATDSFLKEYTTNFGNTNSGAAFNQWSLGTFSISIVRPLPHFFFKLLLPLIIVLTASILVLLLKTEHEISRLALSGTGLLTLIFLQQGYSADLPPTAPLVLMDKFYVLAFCIVLFTFGRIIWETTQVFHHKRAADQFIIADRVLAGILGVLFLGGISILAFVS